MKPTYKSWVDYCSDLFGLGSDADNRMVLRWAKEYEGEGYTPAELIAATRRMFRHFPPQNKWGIPDALLKALTLGRQEELEEKRKQQQAQEDALVQADREEAQAVWRRYRQLTEGIGKMPSN